MNSLVKRSWILLALAGLLSGFCDVSFGYPRYTMVSWGDNSLIYGAGTDPALDTPEGIQRITQHWKDRGYTGTYWRTDTPQFDPNTIVNHSMQMGYIIALGLKNAVDDVGARFDIAGTAVQAAEALDMQFCAWHANIFSDGAPLEWSYHCKYVDDHPEVLVVDRTGAKQWMVPEYGYSIARQAKVNECVYLAQKFGIKSIMPDPRTESGQLSYMYDIPKKADQFGFGPPVVADMNALYGVNILTDPRFDVYSPSFNPLDPMVENWHRLRGGYYTQLLREIRTALNAVDPNIRIVVRLAGDRPGPELGNWILDWRTWVDEGLVDEIVPYSNFSAGFASTCNKGYLVNELCGWVGVLDFPVFRNYINSSAHPNVKLIWEGDSDYFPSSAPPAGADGTMAFWGPAFESFDMAWYQRWQQWKQDIKDFGCIKFIEQNFDNFSLDTMRTYTAEGDYRYHPELRASPGMWSTLGDGTSPKATVQSTIRHGSSGQALKIYKNSASEAVYARHFGGTDHTRYVGSLDNIIEGGRCVFEFWLYRPTTASSMQAYAWYYESIENDIGIQVGSGTNGVVSYSNNGSWVATSFTMPTGVWQKFAMNINFENQTYSMYAGENNEFTLATNIPISTAYNRLDALFFTGIGATFNVTYIDDVVLKWIPDLKYTPPGVNTYLADNFESHTVGDTVHNTTPDTGTPWVVNPSSGSSSFYVEKAISFGDGYKALAVANQAAGAVAYSSSSTTLTVDPSYVVTADFDVYVKSGNTTSIQIAKATSGPYAAGVRVSGSKWQYWNGTSYSDSTVAMDYDMWNHVQITLDCANRTYKLIVQPSGSMPKVVGTYPWDAGVQATDGVFFQIKPTGSYPAYSYFDNVLVTYGKPCPAGDLTGDCKLDFLDFARFADNWQKAAEVGDLDADTHVNMKDLAILVGDWLKNTDF